MANVLEGIEYRTRKAQLPSWRTTENYTEWTACGNVTEFPSGTEFRVTPATQYVVMDSFGKRVLVSGSKTEAMAKVASMISEGNFAVIRKDELTRPHVAAFMSENNIQFKLAGSERWLNPPHFSGTAVGSPIRFRKRPDTYFAVTVSTGITQSNLTFDDVDELSKYLDRQLRTSDNNVVITRRPYDITL